MINSTPTGAPVATFEPLQEIELPGNFAIEMQGRLSKTDDIIDFVQPPISLAITKQFLPKHTELIHYVK